MSSSNFNLRGIPSEVMNLLKKEASRLHVSVNLLILKFLERGLGISSENVKPIYHDLDDLAGTWSEEDARKFKENTQSFEQIDKELW